MNRSVIMYLEEQNLEEGILGGVKDHLKKHWGKYALGAAAIGTGGALLANPALATTAATKLGGLATKAGNAVGLQNAGQAVSSALQTGGQAVTTGAQAVRTAAGGALNTVKTGAQSVKDRIMGTAKPVGPRVPVTPAAPSAPIGDSIKDRVLAPRQFA